MISKNIMIYFVYFYFLILFSLMSNFKSFLSTLILIEFLVLNLFIFICFMFVKEDFISFLMFFLVMVICEGAMGLSILINMIRLGGNSLLNLNNFLMC